jgi:hypothetical protein
VLVSHEVAARGWTEVREGEFCKIPGVGPISPQVGKELAREAIVNAVIYDGKDLRHFKRWSRTIPVEIAIALELGAPPDFDGVKCVDCGNRFRTEFDHVHPYARGGPTSGPNLEPPLLALPPGQARTGPPRRPSRQLSARQPARSNGQGS